MFVYFPWHVEVSKRSWVCLEALRDTELPSSYPSTSLPSHPPFSPGSCCSIRTQLPTDGGSRIQPASDFLPVPRGAVAVWAPRSPQPSEGPHRHVSVGRGGWETVTVIRSFAALP